MVEFLIAVAVGGFLLRKPKRHIRPSRLTAGTCAPTIFAGANRKRNVQLICFAEQNQYENLSGGRHWCHRQSADTAHVG